MKHVSLLLFHRRRAFLLAVFMCIGIVAFSQQAQNISGTVTDESTGESLPGVHVLVQGTDRGTITDINGKYNISAAPGDLLSFSFIGYENKEIQVGNETIISVTLGQDATALKEVVVVGYGSQEKATVTGSISSIETKEIKQSPAANLAVALTGRLPGLTSIQQGGEPGRDASLLYLRGRGTINGQNPLVLVDGVERDLEYIDPNEVESITILKDASSTAVFGVRGANGVILVTTKRGTKGRPDISYTSEYGLQSFTREPDFINSHEFALLKNQAAEMDGEAPVYSEEAIQKFKEGGNPLYPNNNWREMLLHKYVPQIRHNLNLSGGGDDVQYFVNVGYLNQSGQWKVDQDEWDPSSFLHRYNFRSNVDVKLNNSLRAFLNVAGYLEKVNSPNADAFLILAAINENASVRPGPLTPEGEITTWSGATQPPPYAYINRSGYRQETRSNVLASFGMEQDLDFITSGLSAKIMGSFDTRSNYRLTASGGFEEWLIEPGVDEEGNEIPTYRRARGDNTPLSLSTGTSFESKSNFQLFLNYARVFNNKHAISGLIFGQKEQLILPTDRLPFNLIGVSSRFTYGYDSKYFVEFNAGYNGSEQFAPGKRFGFFPAVSLGWLVSDENFLYNNDVLTHLKLRGSYGMVGNDKLGSRRFLYLDDIQKGGGGYTGSLSGTINESFIGNPNIQWEVAKKANVGVEIGLFDQLDLTVDVFKEKRENILVSGSTSAPILNGLALSALPPANIGKVDNHGYEIVLDYKKQVSNDLSILSRINFNYAKNKVNYLGEPIMPEDFAYRYRRTGYSIGQQFGYIVDGYFNSQDEIDNSDIVYNIGRGPRPGDFRYKDVNNDNVIDEKDISPIGYSHVPEYTFGAAFSVNYKNFDLSFLFQGVANVSNYVPFSGWGVFPLYNFYDRHRRAWTPERAASGETIDYPALTLSRSSSEAVVNSFFIERTDYIRLKNAEIGYSLPGKLTDKVNIQKVRFYANGLNLLTWDKMSFKDYDPEIQSSLRYPIYRVFNFGVNVVF
jgi:TonB-linked SusC/RagA family outer membrane protein